MAHITLMLWFNEGFAYAHINLFDIFSLMHLRANYLAFNMYLGKQYKFCTDYDIIQYLNGENTLSRWASKNVWSLGATEFCIYPKKKSPDLKIFRVTF